MKTIVTLVCGGSQLHSSSDGGRTIWFLIPRFLICISLFVLLPNTILAETIRHHRVSAEDPSFPPELIKAEAAIDKQDYSSARPLLESVVEANPNNFQAWFDLGFVFHALQKPDESISAYRKAVAWLSPMYLKAI